MRLLLDTHIFLWWVSDWDQIARPAREAIADPANEVFVSVVSGWEIGVKKAKGRLTASDKLAAVIEEKQFRQMPLTFEHAERAAALLPHHRGPFDRVLVAQAEGLTRDTRLLLYGVSTIRA